MAEGGPAAAPAGPAITLPLGPAPASDAGRGILRMPPQAMVRLGLRPGDTVAVSAERTTHARVLPNLAAGEQLGADAGLVRNLGVSWGAAAEIAPARLPDLRQLTLSLDRGPAPSTDDLYLWLQDVTVTEGDRLDIPRSAGASGTLEVRQTQPTPAGRVGPDTRIGLVTEPGAEPEAPAYPGIAGLGRQIAAVHEMVELPLNRPELFERLGLDPPRGVLFTGPPGSGKTLLARAVAERTQAAFFHIAGPEIVSKHYGDSEKALREVFDAAERQAPAVIFLDEIDAIAPRRDGLSGEKQVERRIVGQLLALMDGLSRRGRVVVMAATNLPDALDPALRRPGRFDREIAFTAPDAADRAAILALHLAQAPLAPDTDLETVAERCHGYVGADLASLAGEAGLAALARAGAEAGSLAAVDAETLEITQDDLDAGFARTRPSLLRETDLPTAPVRWSDLGGLDAAKAALTEAVIWPATHPAAVRRLGIAPPRGILLVGPPGAGKTMLARALAHESGMNFIPVRPAKLLSQYLGEAERAVHELFRRARLSAPALVFFDEIDTLSPTRGQGEAAIDRVTAQMLTELDGLDDNRGVTVLAATNRPEAIDPALRRPGRFDLVLPIELPDAAARREVLAVHSRDRPLDGRVDLATLAGRTEGWSCAALAAAVDQAARHALSRGLAASAPVEELALTVEDFDCALAALARSTDRG